MILWRAGLRQLFRHPWQTVLAVVGVALGVGVVTAVDLANQSAYRAFRLAGEAVAGKATHQVVGGPTGLSDTLYTELRVRHGIRPSAPVVEGFVDVPGHAPLRLIGIDPFAEGPFRSFSGRFLRNADITSFLASPATGMLLRDTAERLGVRQGGTLSVVSHGTRQRLLVCGYLQPESETAREGLRSVILTDISTAQELLGNVGRISRIDLIIPEGRSGNVQLQKVREILPPEATIVGAASRVGNLEQMTRAFRLNLTALSLLALVVGMFLIYNTTTFSVVRRRRLIGLLRAIGVTRREIFGLLLGEALLIGVIGSAAGLLFGSLLGRELIRLVTRTINDLYFVTEVGSVILLPEAFVKGALLGIGATVAAAIPPALEATSAPPRAALSRISIEAGTRRIAPLAALAGVAAMIAGAGMLLPEGAGLTFSFAALFIIIVGYALLVPSVMVGFSRLVRPLMGVCFGVTGRIAARGIVVSLSRTGVATAALVVAVSATIGIGVMVGSFRQTVARWLESWLRADVYVTTVGTGTGRNKPPLDPELVERLSSVSGVSSVSRTRRVTVEGEGPPTELLAMQIPQSTFDGYRFREGDPRRAWNSFSTGEAVIVSEPYAYRHRLHAGDRLSLRTAQGVRQFPVAGVFYDYGSDSGVVAISRSAYERFWNDRTVDGMGFYASPGVSAEQLTASLLRLSGESRISVISNRALRQASLAVFDRTFAITGVLRLLTIIVAFVGILSALMAMQLERARELAVMRAVGLTPAQVWWVICGETGLIGIVAGLLSIPLGIIQALVLVYYINRRSFGWTMELTAGPGLLLEALLLSVTAALLAGLYPARSIAAASPAAALKEEE